MGLYPTLFFDQTFLFLSFSFISFLILFFDVDVDDDEDYRLNRAVFPLLKKKRCRPF